MRWKGLTHLVLIYFYFFIPRFTRLKFYSNRNFPSFPFVFLRVNEKLFIMLRFLSRKKRMKETTVSWESFLPQLTFITRVMKKYIVEKLFLIFFISFLSKWFSFNFQRFSSYSFSVFKLKRKAFESFEAVKGYLFASSNIFSLKIYVSAERAFEKKWIKRRWSRAEAWSRAKIYFEFQIILHINSTGCRASFVRAVSRILIFYVRRPA